MQHRAVSVLILILNGPWMMTDLYYWRQQSRQKFEHSTVSKVQCNNQLALGAKGFTTSDGIIPSDQGQLQNPNLTSLNAERARDVCVQEPFKASKSGFSSSLFATLSILEVWVIPQIPNSLQQTVPKCTVAHPAPIINVGFLFIFNVKEFWFGIGAEFPTFLRSHYFFFFCHSERHGDAKWSQHW